MLLKAVFAFAIFCGLSSAVYIINDMKDIEQDKAHPVKKFRPIAAGQISMQFAGCLAAILSVVSIFFAFTINKFFGLYAVAYFVSMFSYTMILKHVVILDLMIVAIGFVIRAIAGVEAIRYIIPEEVPISPWFITCTLFLALFIVICKRRHELILLNNNAGNHRKVLDEYSPAFLDQMVSIATSVTVISYALYTVTGTKFDSSKMVLTIPFVLYGILRYLYLVYRRDEGGAPDTLLFKDKNLLINVALWLIVVALILYTGSTE